MSANAMKPFGCLVLLALCGALGAAPANAAEKLRFSIPSLSANYAPSFIAMDKGYFAEEGLDVEFVNAGGGIATPGLISGTVEMSGSPASALSAIMRGAPLKIIYTMSESTTYQVWSTQADIKTLADLQGKSVGVATRGDTYEIALRMALRNERLSPDAVGYTAMGFGSAARAIIESKSLPAVVLPSYDVEQLRGSGSLSNAHLIADLADKVRLPYNGIATSDRYLQSNPDTVKKFLRATVKGVAYMRAFKDQTIQILSKYENTTNLRGIDVDYTEVLKTLTKDGTVAEAMQRDDMEMRASLLKMPADKIIPANRVYDFAPLREVNAALSASGWKPTP